MKTPPPATACPAVHMKGIVKRFPGVVATRDVDFRLEKGEIHTLLGENGAGKTTLMKILSGVYRPDAGEIAVAGRPVVLNSPGDALRHGIGMIHQHFQLVDNFTVTENIVLGMPGTMRIDMGEAQRTVATFSDQYGLAVDPRARVRSLSVGEQQRVEILRMLFRNVTVLIMDEPTAVLAPQEIERLFSIMGRIRNEGRSVVFITHKLEEVVGVSDYITVLRRGKVMSTVRPEKIRGQDKSVDRELARMMVGREVILDIGKSPSRAGETTLAVDRLTIRGDRGELAVRDVSFSVRKGEIVAVLGVAGNGQRELAEALVGLRPIESGRIRLDGKEMKSRLHHVAYIPEDRYRRGSVPEMPLLENFALTLRHRFSGRFLMKWKALEETAEKLVSRFNIAARHLSMPARELSGGNLQKLILAREFFRAPRLLIAEQPTRGLDVGATEEIWQTLLDRRRDAAILLVSGDLREVLTLADRILVFFRGRNVAQVSCDDDAGIAELGPLMAGVGGRP